MKKLAIIRSDTGIHKCPFGLSIKNGCLHAGESVLKMTPLDSVDSDSKDFQLQHNVAVYALYGEGRCIYADQEIVSVEVVNCDYGDSGAGTQSIAIEPTPTFPSSTGAFAFTNYSAFPLETYWEEHRSMTSDPRIYGYASLDSRKTLEKQVNSLLDKIAEQENE